MSCTSVVRSWPSNEPSIREVTEESRTFYASSHEVPCLKPDSKRGWARMEDGSIKLSVSGGGANRRVVAQ